MYSNIISEFSSSCQNLWGPSLQEGVISPEFIYERIDEYQHYLERSLAEGRPSLEERVIRSPRRDLERVIQEMGIRSLIGTSQEKEIDAQIIAIGNEVGEIQALLEPHSKEEAMVLHKGRARIHSQIKRLKTALNEIQNRIDSEKASLFIREEDLEGMSEDQVNCTLRDADRHRENAGPIILEMQRRVDELQEVIAFFPPTKDKSDFEDYLFTIFPDLPISHDQCVLSRRGQKRSIGGDGNCFYSSAAVILLEEMRENPRKIIQFIGFLTEKEIPGKERVLKALVQLEENPDILETLFADNQAMLCFVRVLRGCAQEEFFRNEDLIEDWTYEDQRTTGCETRDEYVSQVSHMGVWADDRSIAALGGAMSRIFNERISFQAMIDYRLHYTGRHYSVIY